MGLVGDPRVCVGVAFGGHQSPVHRQCRWANADDGPDLGSPDPDPGT